MIGNSLSSTIEGRLAAMVNVAVDAASRTVHWPRGVKRVAVALVDAMLGCFAVWAAFSLRLGEFPAIDGAMLIFTAAMLGLWYPVALWRGVYRTIFRFSGRGAIIALMVAVMLVTVPLIAAFMLFSQPGIPRTLAILGPLVFFLLISLSRIVGRYILVDLFTTRAGDPGMKRVAIFGAGATGQRLAGALGAEAGMRVVGFIDDDPGKHGHFLDGVPVHHSAQIRELIERRGVTDIVIAITNVSLARRKEIIAALEPLTHPPLSINVQTLPPMRHLMEGRIGADALRPIAVEDLLGRAVVPEHGDLLARSIAGKVVMVTGAGGSIGSEICRQVLAQRPAALVLVDASEFALFTIGSELAAALATLPQHDRPALLQRLTDISRPAATARLFADFTPHTIYHAAAYKHVPLVEDNVLEAVRNNVMGTRVMAETALRNHAERFILVSTDKAVRPPNVMGASKRMCEIVLQNLARAQMLRAEDNRTVFAMVRFGNVLGSSGSVVPTFQRQIEAGGPVTVTHRDVTRYFMTIFEAAQLVIQAGSMARGGEVFLLDMGQPVKIWDLAASMIRLAGLRVRDRSDPDGDIAIVETGLRPGEKLYEELLIGDDSAPTEHPRIMQGHEDCPAAATVEKVLTDLETAIALGDERGCKIGLNEVVPTLAVGADGPRECEASRPAKPVPLPGPRQPSRQLANATGGRAKPRFVSQASASEAGVG